MAASNVSAGTFVKRHMRKLAFAFALCALATPALTASGAAAADETEHVSRTLKLDPAGTVKIRSFSGKVTVTAGDRAEVVVEAERRAPRSRLDRIKLDVHAEGANTVVIDANTRERSWWRFSGNNVVETDLTVTVPRQTNLDISVFSAPVTVERVDGNHRLNSFSAPLKVQDVAGPIWAHTFSGGIDIRERALEGTPTIEAQTFSGNIDVHVPDSTRAAVSFNSFSGHLNSEMPLTLQTSSRRSLKGELGGGGGAELRFKTFSGSVRIDR